MQLRTKFVLWLGLLWLLFVVLGVVSVLAFWTDLDAAERLALRAMLQQRIVLLVILGLLLPFVLALLVQWWIAAYPGAARRMGEEVRLIHTVNPAHRLGGAGGSEMRELGAAINELAQAHAKLQQDIEERIAQSNARLARERNRLAALMSEVVHSVLVCNREGRILLYNDQASQLLGRAVAGGSSAGSPVGLGRSVFGVLERSVVLHALESLAHRVREQLPHPVARFVTRRESQLLRALMAPVLGERGELDGFVLVLEDITLSVEQ